MKITSIVLSTLLIFASAVSSAKNTSGFSIRELVNQYYHKQQKQSFQIPNHRPPNHCEPEGPSCLDVACEKLGTFGCDSMSEIEAVGAACRGNYDGTCLEAVCDRLGTFGCDSMSEIQTVTRACVGNYNMDCFNSVCQKLGTFGCDSVSEIQEVLKSCAGN